MKTNWKAKLKSVAQQIEKTTTGANSELTKADESLSHSRDSKPGFADSSPFVSGQTPVLSGKRDQPDGEILETSPNSALTKADKTPLREKFLAITANSALTITDKTIGSGLSSAFVSAELEESRIISQPVYQVCPNCGSSIKAENNGALAFQFCDFCDFRAAQFQCWDAAYDLAKEMFEAATYDECCTMTDALSERAAIFMTENGCSPEDAIRAAEADLIPGWLDQFQLKQAGRDVCSK